MQITEYLICNRNDYEQLTAVKGREPTLTEILEERDNLYCPARLFVKERDEGGTWSFKVTRQVGYPGAQVGYPGADVRVQPYSTLEALFIRKDTRSENVAIVDGLTNAALDGLGVSSWLLDRAYQQFVNIAGPDPWLSGDLSSVDNGNPRRIPFWTRHIGQDIQVDSRGNGKFCGPWLRPFRRDKAKFVPIMVNRT